MGLGVGNYNGHGSEGSWFKNCQCHFFNFVLIYPIIIIIPFKTLGGTKMPFFSGGQILMVLQQLYGKVRRMQRIFLLLII